MIFLGGECPFPNPPSSSSPSEMVGEVVEDMIPPLLLEDEVVVDAAVEVEVVFGWEDSSLSSSSFASLTALLRVRNSLEGDSTSVPPPPPFFLEPSFLFFFLPFFVFSEEWLVFLRLWRFSLSFDGLLVEGICLPRRLSD